MDGLQHVGPAVVIVILLLGLSVVVCWIILPFAILGTKPLLRQLLAEQRRTNELLVKLKNGSHWRIQIVDATLRIERGVR